MTESTEAQSKDIELDNETQARQTTNKFVIASLAAGLIPMPIVDLVALSGLQLGMIQQIGKIYDQKFTKSIGKSAIAALVGGGVPVGASATVASFLKAIPLIGTIAGAASTSLLGGASTYAVGKVFIQHFETGGTMLSFNPEKMRAYYKEQLQEGKAVAANLKAKGVSA